MAWNETKRTLDKVLGEPGARQEVEAAVAEAKRQLQEPRNSRGQTLAEALCGEDHGYKNTACEEHQGFAGQLRREFFAEAEVARERLAHLLRQIQTQLRDKASHDRSVDDVLRELLEHDYTFSLEVDRERREQILADMAPEGGYADDDF